MDPGFRRDFNKTKKREPKPRLSCVVTRDCFDGAGVLRGISFIREHLASCK